MSNREAMLLEVIRIVRCHPDFDNGGPMADMMDQALAGVEHPDAVVAIANLARGLKPPPVAPRPEVARPNAVRERHIEGFRDLKPNWNSYGAEPITEETICLALRVSRFLNEEWKVVPCGDSRIEFYHGDEDEIIEVYGHPQSPT